MSLLLSSLSLYSGGDCAGVHHRAHGGAEHDRGAARGGAPQGPVSDIVNPNPDDPQCNN